MTILNLKEQVENLKLNWQVETVGDKYMAVSGLPEPCQQHARCIARLALDMMDLCKEVIVDNIPVVNIKHFEISVGLLMKQKNFHRVHNVQIMK